MTGILQPLDNKFAIVDRHGNPTDYFIRWAQQKQIDIGSSITLTDLANYLAAHPLIAGTGIQLTPDGNIADGVNIHADVQAILDEITATRGALLYRGLLGWAALLPDTAGKVLSTNGAGADPSWITPAAGGSGAVTLISEVTPTGTGTVSFLAIPNTFKHLQLRISGRSSAAVTNTQPQITFNSDTGANYDIQITQSSGGANTGIVVMGQTFLHGALIPGASAAAGYAGHGIFDIFNYADTNLFKSCRLDASFQIGTASGNLTNWNASAGWRNAAAIARIDAVLTAGNWVAGSILSLYGIS